jgi:hypothetical protein
MARTFSKLVKTVEEIRVSLVSILEIKCPKSDKVYGFPVRHYFPSSFAKNCDPILAYHLLCPSAPFAFSS